MTEPEAPIRIRTHCQRDKHGRYVPWFVWWRPDGEPDFRVIAPGKIQEAIRFSRCWMCGDKLGRIYAFVIGPMCAVNRNTAEPPCHTDCAAYAASVCPFLTTPKMHRRSNDLPAERSIAGCSIDRNPGVALVWVTRRFKPYVPQMGKRGILFELGDPEQTLWFACGRTATREEIMASLDSGMPLLREQAALDGEEGLQELERMYRRTLPLLPAA